MVVKRFSEFPEGSGTLSNEDIFLFMDNPSSSGVTKKISLSQMSAAIGGGGGGITLEQVQDDLGNSFLVAGTGISLNYVDGSGTLTISASGVSLVNEPTSSPSITSNVLTLDMNASRIFLVNLNADITTLTISNVPAASGISTGLTVIFTGDGTTRSVTWPLSVKWPSAVVPSLTSTNGQQSIISLVTNDNGTSWLGFVGGLNY